MRLQSLVGGGTEVIGPEATLQAAAERMSDLKIACLAVVDRTGLIGILTERDILEAMVARVDPEDTLVEDFMSAAPDVFSPDVKVDEAALWLLEADYRHLPVMVGRELLGIVGIRDILWALTQVTEPT